MLDRTALQTITDRKYRQHPQYGDRDHNLSGLFNWEKVCIDKHFTDCKTVLVGGAGGGRETLALAESGIQVDAFECSGELVESANALLKEQGRDAVVVHAEPSKVPIGFDEYDGLLMGWGAYSHIAGRENRTRFLREYRRHVRPGGVIMLSFFARDLRSRSHRLSFLIARLIQLLRLDRTKVEIGDALYGEFIHCFTEQELRSELEASDFGLEYYGEKGFGHAIGRALPIAHTS